MKKVIFMVLFALASAVASAQSIGVRTLFGSEIESIGIGVMGQYEFTDRVRGAVSFDAYIKNKGRSMWDFNVDGHYLFPIVDRLTVYPIGGITYINDNYSKDDHSSTTHRFGINAGAGADYELTEDLSLTAETKFQLVNGFNQAVASIGIVYNF